MRWVLRRTPLRPCPAAISPTKRLHKKTVAHSMLGVVRFITHSHRERLKSQSKTRWRVVCSAFSREISLMDKIHQQTKKRILETFTQLDQLQKHLLILRHRTTLQSMSLAHSARSQEILSLPHRACDLKWKDHTLEVQILNPDLQVRRNEIR